MAKTTCSTLHPSLSVASEGFAVGVGGGGAGTGWQKTGVWKLSSQAPSRLQTSSPAAGKMAKSCSCWDDASLRPGWSCSSALSLHPPPPLNNTILPPKIKLYLYLYNTPSSPALPSRRSRGLCYRQGIAGARWLQTHIRWGAAAPRRQAHLPGAGAGVG